MTDVASIFETLGGPAKVARILHVGVSTASEMKRRGSIPVRWWPPLIEAGSEKGVTAETLVAAHSNDPREGDAA